MQRPLASCLSRRFPALLAVLLMLPAAGAALAQDVQPPLSGRVQVRF